MIQSHLLVLKVDYTIAGDNVEVRFNRTYWY